MAKIRSMRMGVGETRMQEAQKSTRSKMLEKGCLNATTPTEYLLKKSDAKFSKVSAALWLSGTMIAGGGVIAADTIARHLDSPMQKRQTSTIVKGVTLENVTSDLTSAYAKAVPSSHKLSGPLLLKAAKHAKIDVKRAPVSLPYFLMLVHENANEPKSAIVLLRSQVKSGKATPDARWKLSALEFVHGKENADVMKLVHSANKSGGSALNKSLKAMVARNLAASMPSKR